MRLVASIWLKLLAEWWQFYVPVRLRAMGMLLGKDFSLVKKISIFDIDFHPTKPEWRRFKNKSQDIGSVPVYIANNVFISTGVIILKGVIIGCNSVIGAMSVLSHDISENSVWTGTPARFIQEIKNGI